MGGYVIDDLNYSTRMTIKFKNIDKNKNGLIDNGEELCNLLSATNTSNINELADMDDKHSPHLVPGLISLLTGAGIIGGSIFSLLIPKSKNIVINAIKASLRNQSPALCTTGGIMIILGTFLTGLSVITPPFPEKKKIKYMETEEPPQVQPQSQSIVQPNEREEIKAKFEEGFKELGISEDTELKEYTPKKGEYWISILKAKYDVDDITAQKMANKIKEMVYDNPKASKQTPVMYLPKTWTFEGKTYQYNDSLQINKTDKYSDNIKTEMGKMSKDLKYE